MRVLGIESSCDETGLAVYDTDAGLLSHALFSQIDLHQAYGGVVPELASRDHIHRVLPLIREVLASAQLRLNDIDGIAYTAGPGLIGALLVGAAAARALAWSLDVPSIGVHHMEGHLLAPLLETGAPEPPFVALLVSGGHTQLIEVKAIGEYLLLGDTLDDAVGEAFDKSAKLMGLPYPGGPHLAQAAQSGIVGRHRFSRPMCDRPGLDFSFSGLKTQVLLAWNASNHSDQARADIAVAFEDAATETLAIKCERALRDTGLRSLIVAGGVGANLRLRERLALMAAAKGFRVAFPRAEFCTDNGAMIAFAGAKRLQAGLHDGASIDVRPRWPLDELLAVPVSLELQTGFAGSATSEIP